MNTNNLLKTSLILLICLFGIYIYLYPPNSNNPDLNTKTSGNDTIKSVPIDTTTTVCMDFNKYQPSTLSTGLINEMVSIYRTKQLASIQNATTNAVANDAYSIWFDLDTIKKFIYHIEKGVKKNGTPGSKLGLRLYYAAYPDKTKWTQKGYEDLAGFMGNTTTEQYENKHTLVIIPTIANATGDPLDFDPFVKDTYTNGIKNPKRKIANDNPDQGGPIVVPNFANPTPIMALTPSDNPADDTNKNTARNHGDLCPPGGMIGLKF